jgi:glycosyltransferase involved in cell wall biosynthesis
MIKSYIVIPSPSYGGAEKRFFDIFVALRRQGSCISLIAPDQLIDAFIRDYKDRDDVFSYLLPVPIKKWSRSRFIFELYKTLRNIPNGQNYHYPINCLWLLHIGRSDRVTMTVADCKRPPRLLGGTVNSVWTWLSFFFVEKVDILNPDIFSAMQGYLAAPKMDLTPQGTYILPPKKISSIKEPKIVFLGRLVPDKGIKELLTLIPEIWRNLCKKRKANFKFEIAGYGNLESYVMDSVRVLCQAGIPISYVGFKNSHEFFASASIVLSVQRGTNYPSRIVPEALMAGCGVIVRDSGDSRRFGENIPGLLYCSEELETKELAAQIENLFCRINYEAHFQDSIRDFASARFSNQETITYFSDIMRC